MTENITYLHTWVVMNSVRDDDWAAQLKIIASNGASSSNVLKLDKYLAIVHCNCMQSNQ